MKTITVKVVLPKWAKWVATDGNGVLFAYKYKPRYDVLYDAWAVVTRCEQFEWLCEMPPPADASKTLRRVK